jgi:hypothetical protein
MDKNHIQTYQNFINQNYNSYYKKIYKHNLLLYLFRDLIIESKDKDDVIELIQKNDLQTTPEEFYNSLNKSKHKEMLTEYSIEELSKMKLYKVPNYNIGYAIDNEHNIVAVHNNESTINGIGEILIENAIKNGGIYLDHFDVPILNNIYSNLGFKEYKRVKYDPKYDKDGKFANKYGELDIIYRKLN